MRKKILVTNWKLNADFVTIKKFINNLLEVEDVDVYVAPSYMSILPTINLKGNRKFNICAQNVNSAILGEHTGSVSWIELKDYGINTSIIGHPETRRDFNETLVSLNEKIKMLLENDFKVILCVTESRIDLMRESSKEMLKTQIEQLLANINSNLMKDRLIIVYKPTFSEELSERATPKFVIDTIKIIRNYLRESLGFYLGNKIPLLYGGEYLADDIVEIIKNDNVDGVMVDDFKAVSGKYASLLVKSLYNASTDNYKNYYERNFIIKEPTEIERDKARNLLNNFNEYEIDNELYFKEVDIIDEEI